MPKKISIEDFTVTADLSKDYEDGIFNLKHL